MRLSPICIPLPWVLMSWHSSSGIRLNRVGLEQAPCRTPLCMSKGLEILRFKIKLDFSFLYSAFSISVVCRSAPVYSSSVKSCSLSMLSNAFLTSMSQMWVSPCLCSCIWDISSSVRICSVQLLPFLKPACSSESSPFSSRCCTRRRLIILSISLIHIFINDMGL